MNGGEGGNEKKENFKVEITFNMKCQYNRPISSCINLT